jgi:hypothetical protein
MNFPMDTPLFQYFYWLVNTPGLGGVVVSIVAGGSLMAYLWTLRGIVHAGREDAKETYTYPTPALHEAGEAGDH